MSGGEEMRAAISVGLSMNGRYILSGSGVNVAETD